jgi:hypothetical protein
MNQTIIREFVAKEVRAKAVVRSNKTNVRDENLQEKSNINLSENSEYLRFNSSITRRKQNFAQFIAKTKSNNPEGAQQMERIFSSSDVIAAIAKGISSFGLRVDNVADAYTVYWTNAWLGSRGRSDTLTQQKIFPLEPRLQEHYFLFQRSFQHLILRNNRWLRPCLFKQL